MQTDVEQAIDALARINQQRREALDRTLEAGLPSFVKSITSTEVMITIDPRILPYKQINGQELATTLNAKYGLSLETPGIIKQLERFKTPIEGPGAMIEVAMAQDDLVVRFEGGRFPAGGSAFIPINSLVFGSEAIQANVSGVTDVAETLIEEAFESLWNAAGAIRAWSSREVQNSIQLKRYGTRTKVDLGFNPFGLFDGDVQTYLTDEIKRLGPEMVGLSRYDEFKAASDTVAVVTLDELHFRATVLNMMTGRSETSKIRFSVITRDEQGRGIIDITSELAFDRHVEFVKGLIDTTKSKKHKKDGSR